MRKILITGAGSDLGKALAKKYAGLGAEICIADVNEDSSNAAVEKIQSLGGAEFFVKCNTTQQRDVDMLLMRLPIDGGRLIC